MTSPAVCTVAQRVSCWSGLVRIAVVLFGLLLLHCATRVAHAEDVPPPAPARGAASADVGAAPSQLARVLLLRDYNTRVVLLGSLLLGISAGLVGVFLLLRRRSLMADVISHTTLPGIAIAFLALEVWNPGSGKWTPALLAGAFLSGLIGMGCTSVVVRYTRIKEDAALAIVLSVFFGLGIALFTVVQSLPTGNAAGLSHFIYGKAASMVAADVWLIGWSAVGVLTVFLLLFKEWTVVSFDEQFAAAQGWPVVALDGLLLTLVTTVTVIGLQSVGLLLVVALMIIPATAARCWTYDMKRMTALSALLGGLSALLGVLASAMFPRLAAGAVIVLAGSLLFLFSLLFGARRGIVVRALARRARDRRIASEHLLRAMFECLERHLATEGDMIERLVQRSVPFAELVEKRSWSASRVRGLIQAAQRHGYVVDFSDLGVRLTRRGAVAACRVVRNHRLWELYLIEYTDRSPTRVDRDADDIEHDLGPEIVARLERLLTQRQPAVTVPPSPHAIEPVSEEVAR